MQRSHPRDSEARSVPIIERILINGIAHVIGCMHFPRFGKREIRRNIGGRDIITTSFTDGEIRELPLKAQQNDLRTAGKIESACGIERVQNIFICDFESSDSGVTGLGESAESK